MNALSRRPFAIGEFWRVLASFLWMAIRPKTASQPMATGTAGRTRMISLPAFAVIWTHWAKDNEAIESCVIVTKAADDQMIGLHTRMPVMLAPKVFDCWLAGEFKARRMWRPCSRSCRKTCGRSTRQPGGGGIGSEP